MTSIGKIDYLKAFIKYTFFVDYTKSLKLKFIQTDIAEEEKNSQEASTVHNEIVLNLFILIKQILPLQDVYQINLIFKNCWFFLELILKSICLYAIQYKKIIKNTANTIACLPTNFSKLFNDAFYGSLRCLCDLLIELIVKYGVTSSTKDLDFTGSIRNCNRSLAMFIKVNSHIFFT
jgi:hypothetical protein